MLVIRFAMAVLVNAAAFVVWDVGTRPVTVLGRDIGSAFTQSLSRGGIGALVRGLLRLLTGVLLLALGAVCTAPAALDRHMFTILETTLLVAGLLVETLVGGDLRRRSRAA